MRRGFLSLLTLVALTGTLVPPATCMGIGRPCCCAGSAGGAVSAGGVLSAGELLPAGEPLSADELLSGAGCSCDGPELLSCSPEAKPATAPKTTGMEPARSATPLPTAVQVHADPIARTAVAATSSPPPTPSASLLCCLRI